MYQQRNRDSWIEGEEKKNTKDKILKYSRSKDRKYKDNNQVRSSKWTKLAHIFRNKYKRSKDRKYKDNNQVRSSKWTKLAKIFRNKRANKFTNKSSANYVAADNRA